MTTEPGVQLHVTFVCTYNFCRSPMAEKMFAHQIRERGLASHVRVTSAGTCDGAYGTFHVGSPVAEAAGRVLRSHGYPTTHRAAQLNTNHLGADLVVALAGNHVRRLTELGVPADRVRLLRSFDPRSGAHALDVEDPHYAFQLNRTFEVIEASLPGLHDWVDAQLAARGVAIPLTPTGERG
jgi:protein-tyrosine phosphatase